MDDAVKANANDAARAQALAVSKRQGDALREWLDQRGMRHVFFAQKLGVGKITLSRWLAGHHVPDFRLRPLIEEATDGAIKAEGWTGGGK